MLGTRPGFRDRENTQQCKVTFLAYYINPAFLCDVSTCSDRYIYDIKGHNFEVYSIYNCCVI